MDTANVEIVSSDAGIVVQTYREEGFEPIPKVFLEDHEYARALQRFVPVCADVVVIDRSAGLIYLAMRRSKPMQGWWWIGGGMLPNETRAQAGVRCFERETKISLSEDRLKLVSVVDYLWKDRQQEPQSYGCHMLGFTYVVELTAEEFELVELDPHEYESGAHLVPFTREKLVSEGTAQCILNFYDTVFPPA